MQSSHASARSGTAFELKGSLFTLTVLHLLNPDINVFVAQLRRHAQKTPNLFKNMPVVIDLQRVHHDSHAIDFVTLQHHLRQYGLIPVGVRHGTEPQNTAAQAADLAILSNQAMASKSKPVKTGTSAEMGSGNHTLFITKPVRSGQQVYARNANLVITAPVSHGAELLADGFIHVYGSLCGRALAGLNGDKNARIFCQYLEAELVSIAGYYKLHDDFPTLSAPITQIFLENDQVVIEGITGKQS